MEESKLQHLTEALTGKKIIEAILIMIYEAIWRYELKEEGQKLDERFKYRLELRSPYGIIRDLNNISVRTDSSKIWYYLISYNLSNI